MQRFVDRRVIVTGAGSGIGQATVVRLLDEGATVVAVDISAAGLTATTQLAAQAGHDARLTTVEVDVSVEADVVRAVDAAVAGLGGLDVLVNAAAIQLCAHTHEHSLADWNRTLAVNVTGLFLMTRQALPALCASGHGVLVNFTSTAARFAHPYMAAYSASKGAVLAFTHGVALEYASQGLRAVNIQPGGVDTPLAMGVIEQLPAGFDVNLWVKQFPALRGGTLGEPAQVASVVAMVASDDGAFITGTEIRVDGGAHA